MDRKRKFRILISICLFPLGYLIFWGGTFFPQLVEKGYSNGIYKFFAKIISFSNIVIPFSIAEILFILFIVISLFTIVKNIFLIIKKPSLILNKLVAFLLILIVSFSTIYFSFILLWGLNYQRLSFGEIAGFDTRPASTDELEEVCKNLAKKAKELRKGVSEDKNGVMKLDTSIDDTLKRAYKGYENSKNIYPQLSGNYGRPKAVLLSEVMSYLGIEGIYSPFTVEANVNVSIPHSSLPMTTCHEMAHQRGFSREDEANYIGYVACKNHPDKDFQYSGTLVALMYSSRALNKYSPQKYSNLTKNYSEGMIRDLNALSEYWKKYETPAQDISSNINNAYLKANMQKDGVRSYGRMVDLLIAEFRNSR